jgi:plasmid maintenance system killer protein
MRLTVGQPILAAAGFQPALAECEDSRSREDRKGQHSIRINDQYRICFTWKEDGPHDVEITNHYR